LCDERLNYEMSTEFPIYAPYKEFQCDAANSLDADGTTELDDMYGHLDGFATSSGVENVSPSVLHGITERLKASNRQSIQNLQHSVEHKSVVELLKILEDGQCPGVALTQISPALVIPFAIASRNRCSINLHP
jgi:hypothetical protein